MRIAAVGFLGLGNLGDEALADALWKCLGGIPVPTTLLTIGHRRLNDPLNHGVAALPERLGASRAGTVVHAGLRGRCRRFDLRCVPDLIGPLAARLGGRGGVIFLGGYLGGFTAGAFVHCISILVWLMIHGTAPLFWGSGFGPFPGMFLPFMRLLFSGVRARGTLRDSDSLANAAAVFGSSRLGATLDPVEAIGASMPPDYVRGRFDESVPDQWIAPFFTGSPEGLSSVRGALLIPMRLPGSGHDRVFLAAVSALSVLGFDISILVMRSDDIESACSLGIPGAMVAKTFGQVVEAAARAEVVVTARYHGMIAASVAGTPCVSVSTTPKGGSPSHVWPGAVVKLTCQANPGSMAVSESGIDGGPGNTGDKALTAEFSRAVSTALSLGPRKPCNSAIRRAAEILESNLMAFAGIGSSGKGGGTA